MRVGSVCIFLAPTVTDREDHLSFKVKLGQARYSRLLYLAVVDAIDVHEQTITWVYVGPLAKAFAQPKGMAKGNASKNSSWVLITDPTKRHTAVWADDEMIVSWDKTINDRGWAIPVQQYDDCVTVLKAMEEQDDHDSESSSDSDDDPDQE